MLSREDGAVAELADALDLGSSSERSAGSIPVSPIFILYASPIWARVMPPDKLAV